MCASSLSLSLWTHSITLMQQNNFKIGYYKKQSFTTGKNVVHDEKDLTQARSLSLSLFLSTRKEMQQLIIKWKQVSPGPDDNAFPYGQFCCRTLLQQNCHVVDGLSELIYKINDWNKFRIFTCPLMIFQHITIVAT